MPVFKVFDKMTSYSLTIDSSPQGIPVQVTTPDKADWIMTPTTRSYEDTTTLTIKAPINAVLLVDDINTGYGFQDWTLPDLSKDTANIQTVTVSEDATFTADYLATAYYPVRHPARRSAKYTAKMGSATSEQVAQSRTIALKPLMVDMQQTTATEQATLEFMIHSIVHDLGITGIFIHHYRNFSQELYSLKKRFTTLTLQKEAQISANRWQTKGLDKDILTEIALRMGITITLT
jgi:hypothetical protein